MQVQNEVVTRAIAPNEAKVNVTWAGQNADLPDAVLFDLPDETIRAMVAEAVRGGLPGIAADAAVNISNHVVDRFAPTEARPWNLLSVRPKTEFG